MKIGHFSINLGRSSDGASQAAQNLAQAQTALGHDISLFSWKHHASPNQSTRLDITNLSDLTTPKSNLIFGLSTMRAHFCNLDLLHIHAGYYSPITALVAGLATSVKIPYVYSPHGALGFLRVRKESWKQYIFGAIIGLQFLNQAQWVQVYSREEINLLQQYGVTTSLPIIYNGVELKCIKDAPKESSKFSLFKKNEQQFQIGFLGRLDVWTKGLDILLRAFAIALQDCTVTPILLIAGPDWYGKKTQLITLATELGINANVQFMGEIENEEVSDFLKNLDILAIPSRYEGFPLVFLEACAVGCPVIVTTGTNISELVMEHGVGLVADSVTSFAKAISFLVNQREVRENLKKNASLLAKDLSWTNVAKQICERYQLAIEDE